MSQSPEFIVLTNTIRQLDLLMDRMDEDWLTFEDVIGSNKIHQQEEYPEDDGEVSL